VPQIHNFLRDRRERILRTWETLVLAEVRRVDLNGLAFRDTIPGFLDELADWLETGHAPGGRKLGEEALRHVFRRLDQGLDLGQVLREYRLLRQAILHVVLEAEQQEQERASGRDQRGLKDRVVELARLNAGLDVALADSIESFVGERDRRARAERERAEAEVRDANERLREADRRKDEFLAVLSHELRNPLAPIRNSIYLLEHAREGTEPAARAREVLRRQTDQMTRLVEDLLDVSRIKRGKITLKRERLDLRDVVRKTMDDLRSLFEQGNLELRVEEPADPVWVDGDAVRLAQVLGNLLQNAVKFTGEGGTVTVGLDASDQHATLSVRDTGAGMNPGQEQRMFEPFEQGGHDVARTWGGLGLGLALVKGLVELQEGSVSAKSEGPGRGSEFVITLPIAEPPSPPAQTTYRPGPPSRLLVIVDDNVDAGQTLADILEMQGHRARVARDARSGLERARQLKPDAILCDIGLPGMDGYEFAKAVRQDPALARTFLIAISGYAQPEDCERARQAGFDAHVSKPPSLEQLEELLREGTARRP
jgi:signal transduction histidine kinase/CheY-like chemotaxis protein